MISCRKQVAIFCCVNTLAVAISFAMKKGYSILTKIFTDRAKSIGDFLDVGDYCRYRLQIPQKFGSVILANLPTRGLVCLLNNAKSPVGMTDLKSKGFLGHW